jgi:hypothetical protein
MGEYAAGLKALPAVDNSSGESRKCRLSIRTLTDCEGYGSSPDTCQMYGPLEAQELRGVRSLAETTGSRATRMSWRSDQPPALVSE